MWAGQRTGSHVLLPGPTQRVALLLQRLWRSSGSALCPQLTRCPVEAKAGEGDTRGGVGRAPDSVQIALTSWFLKANALPFPSTSAAFYRRLRGHLPNTPQSTGFAKRLVLPTPSGSLRRLFTCSVDVDVLYLFTSQEAQERPWQSNSVPPSSRITP